MTWQEIVILGLAVFLVWTLVGMFVWQAYIRIPVGLPFLIEIVFAFLCGPFLWVHLFWMWQVSVEERDWEERLLAKELQNAREEEERPNKYEG